MKTISTVKIIAERAAYTASRLSPRPRHRFQRLPAGYFKYVATATILRHHSQQTVRDRIT